jgi:hypothetical protein
MPVITMQVKIDKAVQDDDRADDCEISFVGIGQLIKPSTGSLISILRKNSVCSVSIEPAMP